MKKKENEKKEETETKIDRTKYTFIERRAEILELIIKAGHPKAVSQTNLAKVYGVSQVMIHKDMVGIGKDIKKNLKNDAKLITHVVFQSAIKSLSIGSNDDKFKASKLVKDWNDYLFDIGAQDRAPKKIDQVVQDNRLTAKTFSDAWKEIRGGKKSKSIKKSKRP